MSSLSCFLWTASVLLLWKDVTCFPRASTSLPTPEISRGIARFHANDSHIGKPVPCTHDEKVCFRYNLIFHPKTDRCQPLGEGGHQCFLAADREQFEHGSGHIVGVCHKYDDPCRWFIGYRMAYDGHCYDKDLIVKHICGCTDTPTPHFLGGNDCHCSSTELVQVEQPEEEGRCRIPDFRNPRPTHDDFYDQPLKTMDLHRFTGSCSEAQRNCFEREKVHVAGADGCHTLLKQGPCPEDHVVVLDGRATTKGRAEATCVHVRGGCPPGQKRMAFDGECYGNRDITITAPGAVQMNVYGVYEVLYYVLAIEYIPKQAEEKCTVQFLHFWPPIKTVDLPEAPCDTANCSFKHVFSTPPPFEE